MKSGTNPSLNDVEPSVIADVIEATTPMLRRKAVNPANADEVEKVIAEYFIASKEKNILPTWEGVALACGVNRTTLWRWSRQEGCSKDTCEVVNRAKLCLANIDAILAMKSKISPVCYIFRSKNYYGLSDSIRLETESRAEPEPENLESIVSRYEGLLVDKE